MTARVIGPAPVRRSIFVKASPERAFEVFTAGFDRWWPRSHAVGASPLKQALIEPRAGGRWYEVGEDGSQTQWGEVMVWEPPTRLVLVWSVDADWRYDPGLHTEVEVRFTPEGGGVRVDLEHRNLEAYGERAEQVKAKIGNPNGWGGLLRMFAVRAEDQRERGIS
ncbi:MAG TPA: SRPBCC family protein [Caulobacteraceae bacterium]